MGVLAAIPGPEDVLVAVARPRPQQVRPVRSSLEAGKVAREVFLPLAFREERESVEHDRRDIGPEKTYKVAPGHYFLMGDNRSSSCDSRQWGGLPRENLIGPVFMTYWPPQRISFR